MKRITVVCNLVTGEPLWFGPDRKQESPMSFSPPSSAKAYRGGLCGYVAAVHQQH